jgi:hypothetical protein
MAPDGGPLCVPKTCAQLGYDCGQAGDGCGGSINCNTTPCPSPQFCGGGGFNKCGGNAGLQPDGAMICTPQTCATLGYDCGYASDGCGNQLNCNAGAGCTAPQYCGGGGFDKCGGNNGLGPDGGVTCTPKTCTDLGFNCGPAGDGCGNLIPTCGTCMGNDVCGGGGKPSVCGNTQQCTGLCTQQQPCEGGTPTTITGRVVAGTLPQYGTADPVPGVLVYVPNGPLQPFSKGVQCSQCGAEVSGNPLVKTTTAVDGTFSLVNVPVSKGTVAIPVVIQLGRWRRQVSFVINNACASTAVGDIRMPRNSGEGDIPFTAISTGKVDSMECVLLKMGVDQAEFTQPGGGGRMEMYVGNGANAGNNTPAETSLVNTTTALDAYDQVFFPCWGTAPDNQQPPISKTTAQQNNVISYTTSGGRIFATHFSYGWLYNDPPFSTTAVWNTAHEVQYNAAVSQIDTGSTQGQTLAAWLGVIGALSSTTPPQIPLTVLRKDADSVVAPPSTQWMFAPPQTNSDPNPIATAFPLDYTFDTPINQSPQCGRVIYLDFHVNDATSNGKTFPTECDNNPLTAQEKVLEYMIWQLAQCVPGAPPPVCNKVTCAQLGVSCGPAGDGCGGQQDCGPCTPPLTCGGGGTPSQCGYPDGGKCVPKDCKAQNIACGPAGDGCGGLIQSCGVCVSPQTCGGGGVAGQCGMPDGGLCTPQSCKAQNINCGPAGDGCGNLIQCGDCTPPQTCGGGGMPGQCGGGGQCMPLTCMGQNISCGYAGDGCGGLLDCGKCTGTQTCGGGGTPGKCGGGVQ